MLKTGQTAPDFSLIDQSGKQHNLTSYRGNWVVLYFYPKDNTPGCTKEACSFRDNWQGIKDKAVVLGVSTDSVVSHQKFSSKFNLPFPLLADIDKEVVNAYGVWGPKKFMGKEFLGTIRTTYLIDPDGVIKKIYSKVKPDRHVQEILADLSETT